MKLRQLAAIITKADVKKINKWLKDLKNQDSIQKLFDIYEDYINKLYRYPTKRIKIETSCPTCRAKVITKIKYIISLKQ